MVGELRSQPAILDASHGTCLHNSPMQPKSSQPAASSQQPLNPPSKTACHDLRPQTSALSHQPVASCLLCRIKLHQDRDKIDEDRISGVSVGIEVRYGVGEGTINHTHWANGNRDKSLTRFHREIPGETQTSRNRPSSQFPFKFH